MKEDKLVKFMFYNMTFIYTKRSTMHGIIYKFCKEHANNLSISKLSLFVFNINEERHILSLAICCHD